MTIEYLREYLTLVEHMSFTAASRQLNMTQSALSKHIASLEREFGAVFFSRSAQQIALTLQGRAFCEEASRILESYEAAKRRMTETLPPIRIGGSVNDSAVMSVLTAACREIRASNPAIEITTARMPYPSLPSALADNALDLYVAIELDDDPPAAGLRHCVLTRVPLVAVVNADHPLADAPSVSIEELGRYGIMHPTGNVDSSRGARAVEDVFARHGVSLRKHVFFANDYADFPFASMDGSVFVMPKSIFNKQLFGSHMDELRPIAITDDDALFPYRVIWRDGEASETILRFVSVLAGMSDRLHPVAP
ncbi:LysR family transcriptional regulator [Eggerthella sp. NSJ-70]|uniref:LysR family transcriptional regulator n=1 Tax=Eggerthella hominis TaxID=2763043 RepID=A0ABR7BNM4_9ACTN|nr:LysR family transcriptional regulator [Eggerthella hominis]MBC5583216.1 LysR family transcriptional regulator [Eggerthella hominis]